MEDLEQILKENGFHLIKKKLKNYGGDYYYICNFQPVNKQRVEIIKEYFKESEWHVVHRETVLEFTKHVIELFKWEEKPPIDQHGAISEHVYKPKNFKRTCTVFTGKYSSAEYISDMNIHSFMEMHEIIYALNKEGIKISPRFLEETKQIQFILRAKSVNC